MGFAALGYKFITKRFSTLFVALTIGAIFTDLAVDKGGDYFFERVSNFFILLFKSFFFNSIQEIIDTHPDVILVHSENCGNFSVQ